MSWMFLIVLLAIVAIIVLSQTQHRSGKSKPDRPYEKITTLLSPAELSFYKVLVNVVANKTIVFSKTRICDVIKVKKGLSPSPHQGAFNKISSKHFDFVLCNKNDSSIICAIELNDKSHQSKKRRERDEFLNFACSSAGLPLIVVKAKRNYTLDEIKALLSVYINNDLDELSTEHSSLIGNIA